MVVVGPDGGAIGQQGQQGLVFGGAALVLYRLAASGAWHWGLGQQQQLCAGRSV